MSDEHNEIQGDTFYDHLLQVNAITEEMFEEGDASIEEASMAVVVVMEELTGGYYE